MPEFDFKQFSPEESRIYDEAVGKYREAVAAGKTLKQAYDGYEIADKELESLVQADFLKILIDSGSYVWMGKVVALGEALVGIGLILGAFTGLAAFFGAFMNFNYLMAGTVSVNPMFLVIGVTLLLAWKISGRIGLDYFIVPRMGAIWSERKTAKAAPIAARQVA